MPKYTENSERGKNWASQSASHRRPFQGWFTRPPFTGIWAVVALVLQVVMVVLLATRTSSPPQEPLINTVRVPADMPTALLPTGAPPAQTAPSAKPSSPTSQANKAAAEPQVKVRTLPVRKPGNNPASSHPATSPADIDELSPDAPLAGPPLGGAAAGIPSRHVRETMPGSQTAPRTASRNHAPDASPGTARSSAPPAVAGPTGLMTVYFDADSSTFGADDRRLPLRVELYVDGVKRLDTDEPEKREFEIGQLAEGSHDIRIVPYVGDAPAEPRDAVVRILPGQANRYRAGLRKANGVSQVTKFRTKD
jgi:hypothetical protein